MAKKTNPPEAPVDAEKLIKDSVQDEQMVVQLIKGTCESLAKFADDARDRFPMYGCGTLERIAGDLRLCMREADAWQKHRSSYHYGEMLRAEIELRERCRS